MPSSVVPVALTSFVGRQRELGRTRRAVQEDRLVTLTGPPGVGKSRLAAVVAAEVASAPTGSAVQVVDLTGLGPSDDVAAAIPAPADLPTLLVLDGCEHVLARCREHVVALLARTPDLRVLATSQQPFGVFGEQVVPIGPLGLPGAGRPASLAEARRSEAVQLLEARASASDPQFKLDAAQVADAVTVCSLLDGLPLAIELAATRVRGLGLAELARRLDDPFALLTRGDPVAREDHRSLRAMVARSFALCTTSERRLWSDLSVFAGGADLSAVIAVCGEPGDPAGEDDVLDALDGLVAKSVVVATTTGAAPRYQLLRTWRRFGEDQLAAAGRTALLRDRHAQHFAALARGFRAGFFSPEQVAWTGRVHDDRPNLTRAIDHLLDQGTVHRGTALSVATDLWIFWISGAAAEGRYWLERTLDANPAPTPERALALSTLAVLSTLSVQESDALLAEATAIADAAGSPRLAASVEEARSAVLVLRGEVEAAYAAGRRAMELAASTADPEARLVGYSAVTIAAVLLRKPDAEQTCWAMVAACEAAGDRWLQAWAYHHLAVCAHARDDLVESAVLIDRCLLLAHASGNLVAMAMVLLPAAGLALHRGHHQRAVQLLGGALALSETLGAGPEPFWSLADFVTLIQTRTTTALGEQRYQRALAQGAGWALDQLVGAATSRPSLPSGEVGGAGLSNREWDVARLVAQGKTNRAIAASLHLSPRTVEGHVERILAKRGFRRRTEIAAWATQWLDHVALS